MLGLIAKPLIAERVGAILPHRFLSSVCADDLSQRRQTGTVQPLTSLVKARAQFSAVFRRRLEDVFDFPMIGGVTVPPILVKSVQTVQPDIDSISRIAATWTECNYSPPRETIECIDQSF